VNKRFFADVPEFLFEVYHGLASATD